MMVGVLATVKKAHDRAVHTRQKTAESLAEPCGEGRAVSS
jgi:uncharacterized protein YecA (UPF0149 family)